MKTILVVDDEVNIRNVYRRILMREGFRVLLASNAVDANDIIVNEKGAVDLVLLDIKMAEINGDILFDKIHFCHKNIKVIISSVYPIEEQKERIKEATDYYDKSEGLNTLLCKVKSHLKDLNKGKQKKVVVIDDEARVRFIFTHMLKKAGYESIGFSDNEAALQFLRDEKNRVDLVILDLAMPKIDGCYFFEMIKMNHPNTKILIASAYPVETQGFHIFDADDYFDKSDGNTVLLEKVGMLI